MYLGPKPGTLDPGTLCVGPWTLDPGPWKNVTLKLGPKTW
jgi:hypothetical protein